MAYILATNITSPIGATTAENYHAVKAGRSAMRRYEGLWGLPEPFTASLFSEEQQRALAIDGLTRFESLAVRSIREALQQLPSVDFTAKNVIFILSTTKANVELLPTVDTSPGETAQRIADHLGFTTEPAVVCNACISGVAAIILAQRLLNSGQYDYAVVCGADVQSRFTVAGFQSLKAVAENDCRPFDMERTGLNLGEAAATMVLSTTPTPNTQHPNSYCIENGAIRNDAYHISSPSKNGEGAWLALNAILALNAAQGDLQSEHLSPLTDSSLFTLHSSLLDDLAFINAHGTATMFNDQMESVAIERAGLNHFPVNGLKGYYGHTLGAAGVLETVVSLAALRDHTILATRGFEERGVSGRINVTTSNATTDKTAFVKMISGFGGGNAAITCGSEELRVKSEELKAFSIYDLLLQRQKILHSSLFALHSSLFTLHSSLSPSHRVIITPTSVSTDGKVEEHVSLTTLYKHFVGDYPKYYKMDPLSRLGFIASELLIQAEKKGADTRVCPSRPAQGDLQSLSRAIVLFNSSSSVVADKKFLETIADGNFFPSPSVFVYTLPNIVTGEIAMRNGYHGETSFYVLPRRNEELMRQIILATLQDSELTSMITGWLDYYGEDDYVADLMLIPSRV